LNRRQSEAVIIEKGLSAQTRELSNDLSGLTENELRFRDKMAAANLVAIEGSTVLKSLGDNGARLAKDLEGVNRSLEKNEAQLVQLTVAYRAGEKTEEEYRIEKERLNKEIQAGQAANSILKSDLDAVTQKTAKLDAQLHKLNEEFNAGKIDQAAYRQGLKDIDNSTQSLGSKFDAFTQKQGAELRSTLSSVALEYVGIGAAVYGFTGILGSAVDTVVEFDQSLANVRALGGQYKANIDQLGDAAIKLGPKFGIGAGKAVDSIEALAKAGVEADDILSGGLQGTLALAAAGELQVGEAAEIASASMTQFGLAGTEVEHIADLLAAGAGKAQGSVSDLGAALKQSGLVAAQLGIPLEDTVGTLAAFASNGLTGSDAGTSFKTMLQSLVPRSQEAADTMAKLGIEFFDAQGNFIGLQGAAAELRDSLEGLTQEQQAAALKTIFGSDAVRAASVLYKQGAEGIEEWTGKVNDSGFSMDVARAKLEGAKGTIGSFTAAWETFVLSIDRGDGVLGKLVKGSLSFFSDILLGLAGQSKDDTLNQIEDRVESFVENVNGNLKKLGSEKQVDPLINTERYRDFDNATKLIENSVARSIDNEQKLATIRRKLNQEALDAQRTGSEQEFAIALAKLQLFDKEVAKRKGVTAAAKEGTDAVLGGLKQELDAITTVAEKRAELQGQLDATKQAREGIEASDTAALAANEKLTDSLTKQIAALDGNSQAVAERAVNVKGSVADLQAEIQRLTEKQAQSTESAQFNTYQKQIDTLEESIKRIQGGGGEFDTPMIDEVFGKDPEALPPANVDPGTPMIDELIAQSNADLADLYEEARINEINGIVDFNLERLILEQEYANGVIETREELNARLAELQDQQVKADLDGAQTVLNGIASVANSITALKQAQTDAEVAEIDKRIQAAEAAGESTEALEKEKKRILEENAEQAFVTQKALAVAQLAIDFAKAISGAVAASTAGDPYTFAARVALAIAAVVSAMAVASQKMPQGLAVGGEVQAPQQRGTVRSSWGRPIRRSNGDNVAVTLKTGEKVLNARQQEELERRTHRGIWGDIGLPGHAKYNIDSAREMRIAHMGQGFATGGTVGLITPRPDPQTIVNNQVVAELSGFDQQKIVLVAETYEEVANRRATQVSVSEVANG
jgi:TP901 family phage tail tape measure protein